MTAPKTRAEAKDRTREALLDAGLQLFTEKGLDGPSLDAICDRAGFTRGAFYVHFQDREQFLEAVMMRAGAQVLGAVLAPGAESDDLEQLAARFLGAVASGAYPLTPGGGVRPHHLLDACARSPRLRQRYVGLVSESIAHVAGVIARGQRKKKVRAGVPPRALAEILLSLIVGAQTLLELEQPLDLGAMTQAILSLSRPARAATERPPSKRAKPRKPDRAVRAGAA